MVVNSLGSGFVVFCISLWCVGQGAYQEILSLGLYFQYIPKGAGSVFDNMILTPVESTVLTQIVTFGASDKKTKILC